MLKARYIKYIKQTYSWFKTIKRLLDDQLHYWVNPKGYYTRYVLFTDENTNKFRVKRNCVTYKILTTYVWYMSKIDCCIEWKLKYEYNLQMYWVLYMGVYAFIHCGSRTRTHRCTQLSIIYTHLRNLIRFCFVWMRRNHGRHTEEILRMFRSQNCIASNFCIAAN